MILAGIDEAGLGPTLGPLATASAALRVPDDWRADTPWHALSDIVSDAAAGKDGRMPIADSKLTFKSGGVPGLERPLAAFSLLAHGEAPFPARIPVRDDALPHRCYSRSLSPFPCHVDTQAARNDADALAASLARAGAAAVHLEAAVLHEPLLNRRFEDGLNKNQALLVETGGHLSSLAARFRDDRLLVLVDKQGGRNDYMPFLSALFPGAWIASLAVGGPESAYRVGRGGGDIEVRFRAKADKSSFPTALASMAAKYVRERAMAELNRWFGEQAPDLKPTAGYPRDARRWLADLARHPDRASLDLERLIRLR